MSNSKKREQQAENDAQVLRRCKMMFAKNGMKSGVLEYCKATGSSLAVAFQALGVKQLERPEMARLTYQQMRLMELIDNARRQQLKYLLAPVEMDDAIMCAAIGLINVAEDGSAQFTEAGHIYIVNLNTGR